MNETRGVAVIVGSLRKDSLNRKLANVLAQIVSALGLQMRFSSSRRSTTGRWRPH